MDKLSILTLVRYTHKAQQSQVADVKVASGSGDTIVVLGLVGIGVVLYYTGSLQKLWNQVANAPALMMPATTKTPKTTGTGGRTVGGHVTTPGTSGTPRAVVTGKNIYPVVSRISVPDVAGKNQSITYASSGKAAQSHRSDVNGVGSKTNLEATVYLAWPSGCNGGGHPELAIKFYGPGHTDSSCCYCYTSAVPGSGGLQLGFGGEGPHPSTTTLQKVATTIPFSSGKMYGIKGVIWKKAGGMIHQETWYDAGSGWKLAGTYDRGSCGKTKTSATPASNAQVEFRIDCSNVTYSGTEVVEIMPPAGAAAGYLSGAAYQDNIMTPQDMEQDSLAAPRPVDYQRIIAMRKRHSMVRQIRAVDPAPFIKHSYYANVVDYQRSCD